MIAWPDFSPHPPRLYRARLPYRSDRWESMQAGLYLLAVSGHNGVIELSEGLVREWGGRVGLRSAHRIYSAYLRQAGLVTYQVLPLFRSGLAVARLADFGREICAYYGWPAVASEWDRIIRFHAGQDQPQHSAMLLAFTREARRRGYSAEVVPLAEERNLPTQPDVLIENDEEQVYVEIERKRDKPTKWHGLRQLQGFAAVCTLTAPHRRTLVAEIQEQGIPGRATDLATLRYAGQAGAPGPLWVETW